MGLLDSFKQGVEKAKKDVAGPSTVEIKAKLMKRAMNAKTPEELAQIQQEIADATRKAR